MSGAWVCQHGETVLIGASALHASGPHAGTTCRRSDPGSRPAGTPAAPRSQPTCPPNDWYSASNGMQFMTRTDDPNRHGFSFVFAAESGPWSSASINGLTDHDVLGLIGILQARLPIVPDALEAESAMRKAIDAHWQALIRRHDRLLRVAQRVASSSAPEDLRREANALVREALNAGCNPGETK